MSEQDSNTNQAYANYFPHQPYPYYYYPQPSPTYYPIYDSRQMPMQSQPYPQNQTYQQYPPTQQYPQKQPYQQNQPSQQYPPAQMYQPSQQNQQYPQNQPSQQYPPQGQGGQSQLPMEQSYIENILRMNEGKRATVYMTFENNEEWNAKVFVGIVEAAGRDHIILRDSETGKRYLLLMIYLDYVTFDEELNYSYPYGNNNQTTG